MYTYKNILKLYISFVLLIFSGISSFASHIVGGEMNYKYLGNGKYKITLTVYRDCFNGRAPFDNPASIGFFDDRGNLINSIQVNISLQQSVPNAINSPCIDPPTNVCYELAQYIFTTNVPVGTGACTIAYQRCCRNYSIINMADVQGTGATYTAVITDPSIAPINSNPVFNDWPPTFICKNAPFTFDHSATDPDGDSLVYELSYPYLGADIIEPMPDPPGSPPYSPIIFLPPYSLNNPFGGTPLQINPKSGIMKATPFTEGQFVYGITVKEFRNGIYIGETRRDFQINVVSCPAFTVASIFSPTIACGNLDAHFINNSFNASTYKWSFGNSLTVNDTSSEKDPAYLYPDTGDYIVKLIAFSPYDSLCNDTAEGVVNVLEFVQVKKQQRPVDHAAISLGQSASHLLLKAMAITKSSQRISLRKVYQLLGCLAFARDVFINPQPSDETAFLIRLAFAFLSQSQDNDERSCHRLAGVVNHPNGHLRLGATWNAAIRKN